MAEKTPNKDQRMGATELVD